MHLMATDKGSAWEIRLTNMRALEPREIWQDAQFIMRAGTEDECKGIVRQLCCTDKDLNWSSYTDG